VSTARDNANGPLIVKIGGVALETQAESPEMWTALLSLHRDRLASGKGGVLLVHGGGKAVDRMLDKLGLVSERREGIRITTPEQIDVVTAVLAGSVNKALVGCINRTASGAGIASRAVGLCLGDGGLCVSVKSTRFSFDPGRVGDVTGGNPALARALFSGGFLPVLCSVGLDDAGKPLNINADDAAAALVPVLGAAGLVLMTDVPGIKNGKGQLVPDLTPGAIEAMIISGEITGGMIPKTRAAAAVSAQTGADVFIMSGEDPANLTAWAQGKSIGTRVHA